MVKKRKKLQKKSCNSDKNLKKSEHNEKKETSEVRVTAKLRSKLKNLVNVGQDLWRVFNSKGEAYYCKDPLLLADTVYRRKYDEVQLENLNGQYIKMFMITGRKQK
jgi:hypothetical protein